MTTPTQAAAAGIGEQNKDWIKKRADIRNSAIERCAQVAEQHCCEECGTQIAAAIRALKDK